MYTAEGKIAERLEEMPSAVAPTHDIQQPSVRTGYCLIARGSFLLDFASEDFEIFVFWLE